MSLDFAYIACFSIIPGKKPIKCVFVCRNYIFWNSWMLFYQSNLWIIVKYISTSYLQVDTGIAPEICRLFPWTRLDLRGKLIGNYIDTCWCSKRQGIGLYSVKHIQKSSKGQENQSRITQGYGLDRCRIGQVLLYIGELLTVIRLTDYFLRLEDVFVPLLIIKRSKWNCFTVCLKVIFK